MITYNIASYNRPKSLIKTIASVFDQCDRINLALNSYDSIPSELYDKKITLFITNNDMGDAYKFIELMHSDGYFFSIDDDIIYPRNYTKFMINNVEKYGRKKLITFHGRKYAKFPINSYINSSQLYHFNEDVYDDAPVHIGGTGVMCFHTDLMKIPMNYFLTPNMADIWVAKYAKEHGIEIICAAHEKGYIHPQENIQESIFLDSVKDSTLQTKLINEIYYEND